MVLGAGRHLAISGSSTASRGEACPSAVGDFHAAASVEVTQWPPRCGHLNASGLADCEMLGALNQVRRTTRPASRPAVAPTSGKGTESSCASTHLDTVKWRAFAVTYKDRTRVHAHPGLLRWLTRDGGAARRRRAHRDVRLCAKPGEARFRKSANDGARGTTSGTCTQRRPRRAALEPTTTWVELLMDPLPPPLGFLFSSSQADPVDSRRPPPTTFARESDPPRGTSPTGSPH